MITHWDEVEPRRNERGHLRGLWQDLGRACGTQAVGLKRIRIDPGFWSTPAHIHGREEELFYVLAGSGLSWQGGKAYEIGPGDCLVHLTHGDPHTLRAGEEGLEVLAFGMRAADEASYLPRAGVMWLASHWVDAGDPDKPPWDREIAAGPPQLPPAPSERPRTIVNVSDVETFREDAPAGFAGAWRNLGAAVGSEDTGLKHQRIEPGNLNCPHHVHSAEEEVFVVLEGDGVLELIPAPQSHAGAQEIPVRAGHVVSRPPGSRLAHAFRAGDDALTLLAYGTRDPSDVAFYPRSNKVFFRGAGVIVRAEPLDYWEGET